MGPREGPQSGRAPGVRLSENAPATRLFQCWRRRGLCRGRMAPASGSLASSLGQETREALLTGVLLRGPRGRVGAAGPGSSRGPRRTFPQACLYPPHAGKPAGVSGPRRSHSRTRPCPPGITVPRPGSPRPSGSLWRPRGGGEPAAALAAPERAASTPCLACSFFPTRLMENSPSSYTNVVTAMLRLAPFALWPWIRPQVPPGPPGALVPGAPGSRDLDWGHFHPGNVARRCTRLGFYTREFNSRAMSSGLRGGRGLGRVKKGGRCGLRRERRGLSLNRVSEEEARSGV